MSEDHQNQFDIYDSLHPNVKKTRATDTGGNLNLDDYAYASGLVQPTTDAYYATPETTWEDYLFQIARRDKGSTYYAGDLSGMRWRQTEYERFDDHGHQAGRDFLGYQTFDAPFTTADEMVHYIYDSPDQHPFYTAGQGLFDYERSEYDYNSQLLDDRLDQLLDVTDPGFFQDPVLGKQLLRNAFIGLNQEWSHNILTRTNTRNPDVYRLVYRTNLDNLEVMQNAVNNGARGEDITNMVASLQNQELPSRLQIPQVGPDIAYSRAIRRYHTDTMTREYYEEIVQNPNASFEEINDVLNPGDARAAEWEYLYDNAREAYVNGIDLTERPLIVPEPPPAQPGREQVEMQELRGEEEKIWEHPGEDLVHQPETAEESLLNRGGDIEMQQLPYDSQEAILQRAGRTGDLTWPTTDYVPLLTEDPDLLPQTTQAGAWNEMEGAQWNEYNQFRVVEANELRDTVLRAGVERGDFTVMEAANLATMDMMDAVAGAALELTMGAAAVAPFGGVQDSFEAPTIVAERERVHNDWIHHISEENVETRALIGEQAYIHVGGNWYLGDIIDARALHSMGYDDVEVATVSIDYVGAENQTTSQTFTVPIDQPGTFLHADGTFAPAHVAHWEPYTDPTEERFADLNNIAQHVGQQIRVGENGQWRTLQAVRPGYGSYPNITKTLVWEDGTETQLTGYLGRVPGLSSRVWGADADQPDPNLPHWTDLNEIGQYVGQQIAQGGKWRTLVAVHPASTARNYKYSPEYHATLVWSDGTTSEMTSRDGITVGELLHVRLSGTEGETYDVPTVPHDQPPTGNEITPQREWDQDRQGVMSYLLREHNEVYTIWQNPEYAGTDENRVERIFGGIVPFLSYNSEGHPILTDDKEIDHHGHTEFNMVHRSRLELQEQSTGIVETDRNEATIEQTNPDETPAPTAQGETANP